MDLPSELWNHIFQYASSYPKYRSVSKSVTKDYNPVITKEYIYNNYKGFDNVGDYGIQLYKYNLNKACLLKDYGSVIFMANTMYKATTNRMYILHALEHLHRFGKFNMCKKFIESYSPDLYIMYTYTKNTIKHEYFKYNLLLCMYHLKIPKYKDIAMTNLSDWKKNKMVTMGFKTNQYVGYMNDFIFNSIVTIKPSDQRKDEDLINTNLDYNTYRFMEIKNIYTYQDLFRFPIINIPILNYITREIKKDTNATFDLMCNNINPIIYKSLKHKINFTNKGEIYKLIDLYDP